MPTRVVCDECNRTINAIYGGEGLCPHCRDNYIDVRSHPANAA